MGRSKYPTLVNKLGEIDLATTGPWVLRPGHNDQRIVEQGFYIHVVSKNLRGWRHGPFQEEVVRSLEQAGISASRHIRDAQDDSGKSFRKSVDDGAHERGRSVHRASNPYFATGRIGQELDVLDALPQLIEDRPRAR